MNLQINKFVFIESFKNLIQIRFPYICLQQFLHTFMIWYFKALKQYANFHGRAQRKEYFYYLIINKLIFTGFHELGKYLELNLFSFDLFNTTFYANWLGTLYIAAVLVPSIAVGARRVQDSGKPGLYGFLFPYCLYLIVKEGDKGANAYGESPKLHS